MYLANKKPKNLCKRREFISLLFVRRNRECRLLVALLKNNILLIMHIL